MYMRLIKFLAILLIIVGGILYGVYHFGTEVASDIIVDRHTEEVESHGQLEEVNEISLSDPELQEFIHENKDINALPTTSKEEATRVVLKKVGVNKLEELQTKVHPNLTKEEIDTIAN